MERSAGPPWAKPARLDDYELDWKREVVGHIFGSRSVHDCGCAGRPWLDTQIHDSRHSPYCVLLASSCADSSSKLTLPEPCEGFVLHLTAIPGHETTGVLSAEGVEEIFTFDWFMEWNWYWVLPSPVAETGADFPGEPQDC